MLGIMKQKGEGIKGKTERELCVEKLGIGAKALNRKQRGESFTDKDLLHGRSRTSEFVWELECARGEFQ